MTKREEELLALIKNNPFISQKELADRLQITRSSVAVHITNLMKKGKIRGKGYVVNESDYVVVIGASNFDVSGSATSFIMHDSNPGKIVSSAGGVGRNIAENIALLGIDVRLISVVGTDHAGEVVLQETAKSGVDISYVKTLPARTGTYLSLIEDNDMFVAINDMEINKLVTVDMIQEYDSLIKGAKLIVMDTNFERDVLKYIAETYKDSHLILDPVSTVKADKVKEFIGSFSTVKPNKLEVEKMTGIKIKSEADLIHAAEFIHKKGVKQVVISLGNGGAFYSSEFGKGMIQHDVLEPVNVTGAGDAFVAGLTYGLLVDAPFDRSVEFAMRASEIAMMSEETINQELSLERLLEEL